ncbi:MAG: valine--tRNA ligase [bacterium]
MEELNTKYDPVLIEDKWYEYWEKNNCFTPEIDLSKKPYVIVIPPPNITGILHLGHVLNNTLQDILIRWKRMNGEVSLWLPGTDHAGIATQNVVEKQLKKENMSRHKLGREKFIERVWEWKNQYGETIVKQLRKLGCSCDWTKQKFTLDEELSDAVLEVFIKLYQKGLIYKGKYIVNWCPRCSTAISDEEVEYEEFSGRLYYIKYPIKETSSYITVATTRPETMVGDVAIAVNPEDSRYKNMIDKTIILPIMNRELKIIQDSKIDIEFGTGAVKITPAHDMVDWQISKCHNLEPIIIMNEKGIMNENAGEYVGMDRFECREALLMDLDNLGLLEKVEDYPNNIGHCQRCHTVIEPYLSTQWFVKMKPLAESAIEAVKQGKIKFYPEHWTKIYFNWMENIRDWCISRQIWWGHRIPVYYCLNCSNIEVSKSFPLKCLKCGKNEFKQEEDVLDTWFSSWLWPFSVFGWPEQTKELKYFYPTTTLITAPEIIFFWVARMIMSGIEFMGEVPFKEVYFNGIVRDEKGRKMSKSLGNSPDPIDLIKEFGTDALRFGIVSFAPQGKDILFSQDRIKTAKFFANKIWNASRFVLMNIKDNQEIIINFLKNKNIKDLKNLELVDIWIISRLNQVIFEVSSKLNEFQFNEVAIVLNKFIWHEFCDWYIEVSKLRLNNKEKQEERETAQIILCFVLNNILKLLHPYMPFITEEIGQKIGLEQNIIKSFWPLYENENIDEDVICKMNLIIEIITYIRNVRGETNIPQSAKIEVVFSLPDEKLKNIFLAHIECIKFLCQVKEIQLGVKLEPVENAMVNVIKEIEIYIPKKGLISEEKEKEKKEKEIKKINQMLERINQKLNNPVFIKNAPNHIIEQEKQRKKEWEEKLEKLKK